MTDIKKVLKKAGVSELKAEPLDLHGQLDCFVAAVGSSSPMELWRKLRSVTEETGYYPVFAAKDKLDKWNFEDESGGRDGFEIAIQGPLPGQVFSSSSLGGFADTAEIRAALRQQMLKDFGMSAATPEQLDEPVTMDKFEAAAKVLKNPKAPGMRQDLCASSLFLDMKKNADSGIGPAMPSMNDLIAQQTEQFAQAAKFFAGRSEGYASYFAVRKIEKDALSSHCIDEELPSFDALVAAGEELDIEKWIQLKLSEGQAETGDFSKQKWPNVQAPTSRTLLLLPVKKSWQVPAILRIGGWNENPPAHVHVGLLKRWDQKFGVEIITVGVDTLYLEIEKPITTRDAALEQASEVFAYCPDHVLQGIGDGTISGLAIDLLDRDIWDFWWD